ncbi:MAG TPA: HAMP domain-containing protein [Bryobacteraceae bacterium]|nr:HAMP domain-containing protein [Bryobacteraceae bacterium]
MNRLRNRLILIFLAATLVPLGATIWITTQLLERSLTYSSTDEVDRISRSLENTGREFYQRVRQDLRAEAASGKLKPTAVYRAAGRAGWPEAVNSFFESGEPERFVLAGREGDRLDYFARRGSDVWMWSESLGGVAMGRLSEQFASARELVDKRRSQDLRRGFIYVFVLLAASVWLASLALLVYLAHRVSRPIQELTAGLARLAGGDLETRVTVRRDDEVGRAGHAFNDMAARMKESTERLVYLTQLASWQSLARKMAHEVKNSLTPIRLTVEEMLARHGEGDRAFMEQAAQIVVEEVESLERRVRAFSQFAAEPPVRPALLDVNALVEERIAFLSAAHPEIRYSVRLAETPLAAQADPDLVRGILTNLLENAAHAAGVGGTVLGKTDAVDGCVAIEVHDSGPGLSEQMRASLFQPTISFKKGGMGLGLSIARKSALLSGGDILLVQGELGGAAFRLLLPPAANGDQARPDCG